MKENCKIIKKNNLLSFLICDDGHIDYYLKFNWKLLNNNSFEIKEHKFSKNGMIFNDKVEKDSLDKKNQLNLKYIFYASESI